MARLLATVVAVCALSVISLSGCGSNSSTTTAPHITTTVVPHSPTTAAPNSSTTAAPHITTTTLNGSACLCIFDIDRTLTGKQGETGVCPSNLVTAATDSAYDGGLLTLSELAQHVADTFCVQCFLGTISAGDASGDGSAEQANLHNRLDIGPGKDVLPEGWSYGCTSVSSPQVVACTDGLKHTAVPGIVAWYEVNAAVAIAAEDVHFFDDRVSNVQPFTNQSLAYNARQISCATRDAQEGGAIGLCGATVDEVVADKGVFVCGGAAGAIV